MYSNDNTALKEQEWPRRHRTMPWFFREFSWSWHGDHHLTELGHRGWHWPFHNWRACEQRQDYARHLFQIHPHQQKNSCLCNFWRRGNTATPSSTRSQVVNAAPATVARARARLQEIWSPRRSWVWWKAVAHTTDRIEIETWKRPDHSVASPPSPLFQVYNLPSGFSGASSKSKGSCTVLQPCQSFSPISTANILSTEVS